MVSFDAHLHLASQFDPISFVIPSLTKPISHFSFMGLHRSLGIDLPVKPKQSPKEEEEEEKTELIVHHQKLI